MGRVLGIFLAVFFLSQVAWGCPPLEKVKKEFKNLTGPGVKVFKVQPSPVPGICEVILDVRGQKRLTYVDESGRYLIAGRLIEIATRKNLTQEREVDLNRLPPEQMKKLDSLVAFTEGNGGPVVYLVTDPHCPYCAATEASLLPLIKEGKITLKVIFYLVHANARPEAVSLICQKKGLEDLLAVACQNQRLKKGIDYLCKRGQMNCAEVCSTLKQRDLKEVHCQEGEKKVEEALTVLRGLGVRGTPTFIFSDGRAVSGARSGGEILKMAKKNR
jgi:thiol:disulfide interchange protein DsbC